MFMGLCTYVKTPFNISFLRKTLMLLSFPSSRQTVSADMI